MLELAHAEDEKELNFQMSNLGNSGKLSTCTWQVIVTDEMLQNMSYSYSSQL